MKAHPELMGENKKQVMHFWEGETKPISLGESAEQLAAKLSKLQEFQNKVLLSLQRHFEVIWGKDNTLQLQEPQVVSLKTYYPEQDTKKFILASWKMTPKMADSGLSAYSGYLEIDKNFFYFLYSFIFGGNHFSEKNGNFSKLEKSYLEQFIHDLMQTCSEAWVGFFGGFNFKVDKITYHPDEISKVVSISDFCKSTFVAVHAESQYPFSILYPKELNALFEETQESQAAVFKLQKDQSWSRAVLHALSTTSTTQVKIEAELGTLSVPISQALSLNVGQVLPLKLSTEGHSIYVEGNKAGIGKMGSIGEFRAVQFVSDNR